MNYLLDVNVLVAWGWQDHSENERVVRWLAGVRETTGSRFLTSAMPQLGFVRVSVQRTTGRLTVAAACSALSGMLATLGSSHEFLPDDQEGKMLPDWCHSAAHTTDAHLLSLAAAHGATLVTLDRSIPGGWIIPDSEPAAGTAARKRRKPGGR